MYTHLAELLDVIGAFCKLTRRTPHEVGKLACSQGQLAQRLAAGGDIYTGNYYKAWAWLAREWPEDAEPPPALREWAERIDRLGNQAGRNR